MATEAAAGAAGVAASQQGRLHASAPKTLKQAFSRKFEDSFKEDLQQLLGADDMQDCEVKIAQCFKGAGWTQQRNACALIKHMRSLVQRPSTDDDGAAQDVFERLQGWEHEVEEWQVCGSIVMPHRSLFGLA